MQPRKQIAAILAIVIIVVSNGWHLAPIQGYAWLSMAIEDAQSEDFVDALKFAMEERELCGICQYVIEQESETNDTAFGYWNMIPKWLLAVPAIPRFAFPPQKSWNRILVDYSGSPGDRASLDPPPPKRVA